MKDHWEKVQEATTKSKLEEVKAEDLDKTVAVAASTYSMRKNNIIAQIWEKNKTHAELETLIYGQTKADQMKKKVQVIEKEESKTMTAIKSEPVGAVSRKRRFSKSRKHKNPTVRKCRRSGEKNFQGHNSECKANGKTCKECEKVGLFASCCFKRKNLEENKVSRVEERNSEDMEDEETSSSYSSIFLIRPVNKVSQIKENGSKIMLDIYINGRKIETLPYTGSPISVIPRKMIRWLQLEKRLSLPYGIC